MKIYLISTTSRRNAINKQLGYTIEYTGTLRDETDFINPVVMINIPTQSASPFNYMYIPAFKRYYFIDNITSITSQQTEFRCSVDVLYSFKDYINGCIGTAERQQYLESPYLNDDKIIKNISSRITTTVFPNKMTGESFVLVVNGFNVSS